LRVVVSASATEPAAVPEGFATLTSSVKVVGGSAQGSTLTLRLSEGLPKGSSISYLDSKNWSQDRLLMGANGLPALTFRSVPIR
jgi:hypothetical protein